MKNHERARRRIMSGKFWTQSWSPIVGCKKCSPGCYRCWAETMVLRMQGAAASRGAAAAMCGSNLGDHLLADLSHVLAEDKHGKPTGWSGHHALVEHWLDRPLRWRKPRVVATGWLGDMWEDAVTDRRLGYVMEIARTASFTVANQFLFLTKRPQRMARFFEDYTKSGGPMPPMHMLDHWHGATIPDQATADRDIPHLLGINGRRWLCIEPMLGPVDLIGHPACASWDAPIVQKYLLGISWVVVGQETGPGARPAKSEWIQSVIDQCRDAGVPVWTKALPGVPAIRQAPAPIAAILREDKGIVAECRRAGVEIEVVR